MKAMKRLRDCFAAGAALFIVGGVANAQSAPYGPPASELEATDTVEYRSDVFKKLEQVFASREDRESNIDKEGVYRMMADDGYVEYYSERSRQDMILRAMEEFQSQKRRRAGVTDQLLDVEQLDISKDIPTMKDVEDFETDYFDRNDLPHIFGAVCVPYNERLSTVCMKSMMDGRASFDVFYDNREINELYERDVETVGMRFRMTFK